MFRAVRFVLIAGLAAFAATAAATTPTPLTQAVEATQAAKVDYAFDLHLRTSKQDWRARFDPSTSPRLRLVSPSRAELSGEERRAFDRLAQDMEGVSWCAGENMVRVGDVRLLREDEATVTYAFQPTRESVRGEQARRFADRMRGELTLIKDNPDISHIRVYTPAPFSPLPLVRVDRVNVAITCQTAPNGRRYAAETVSDVSGSAFGQDFNERSVQSARNLAAAP